MEPECQFQRYNIGAPASAGSQYSELNCVLGEETDFGARLTLERGCDVVPMKTLRIERFSRLGVYCRSKYRGGGLAGDLARPISVPFAQSMLNRGAGLDVACPAFVVVAMIGGLFFGPAIWASDLSRRAKVTNPRIR